MIELLAKDFNNRQQLEAKVSSLMGLTADPKPDYAIKGSKQELKKLWLGHGAVFWGIKCELTDFTEPPKIVKVERGKIYKSKLETLDIKNSEELGSRKKRK